MSERKKPRKKKRTKKQNLQFVCVTLNITYNTPSKCNHVGAPSFLSLLLIKCIINSIVSFANDQLLYTLSNKHFKCNCTFNLTSKCAVVEHNV